MNSPALVSPNSGRGSRPDGDRNAAVCPVGFPLPWQRQRHSPQHSRASTIPRDRLRVDPCERNLGYGRGLSQEGAMTSKTYTLMVVHAHPDDESSSTGGLLRLAAEQGHTTILVTCTNGELGKVNIPDLRLNPRKDPADPAAPGPDTPGRIVESDSHFGDHKGLSTRLSRFWYGRLEQQP